MLVNAGKYETELNEDMLSTVFAETYPLDSSIGARRIRAREKKYRFQPLVQLTSFLGLPNKQRLDAPLTWFGVLKNMLDLNPKFEASGKLSKVDVVLAPVMFIYHLVLLPFRLIFNIAKIFTELLPGLGEEVCRRQMNKFAKTNAFLHNVFKFGMKLCSAIQFIGRAVTSPLKGMYAGGANGRGWGVLSGLLSIAVYAAAAGFGYLALLAVNAGSVPAVASTTNILSSLFIGAIYTSGALSHERNVLRSRKTYDQGFLKRFIRGVIKLVGGSSASPRRAGAAAATQDVGFLSEIGASDVPSVAASESAGAASRQPSSTRVSFAGLGVAGDGAAMNSGSEDEMSPLLSGSGSGSESEDDVSPEPVVSADLASESDLTARGPSLA